LKPRALYFQSLQYQPANVGFLQNRFDVISLPNPDAETPAGREGVEVLFAPLGWMVDAGRMELFPRLRAIVSNTTGVPHIDLEAARLRGIAVCALHEDQGFLERITPTAEHTIGLLLAVCRRVPAAHAAALRGEWNRRPWGAPRMLSRMRLGIVGYGRLGRKVAACGIALGMDVAYYDPRAAGSTPDLFTLASRSDILSLHAPATPQTAGIVSRQVIDALPKGALLINTARGELIDEDALVDALEREHLGGAALDTLQGEYDRDFQTRFATSRVLAYARQHDNLILTPHIGGSTVDAWFETERRVIEKCCRVLGLRGEL
jgi:D-3-phosphoglycerate dehydrogenase